jgi:hypothetical protein
VRPPCAYTLDPIGVAALTASSIRSAAADGCETATKRAGPTPSTARAGAPGTVFVRPRFGTARPSLGMCGAEELVLAVAIPSVASTLRRGSPGFPANSSTRPARRTCRPRSGPPTTVTSLSPAAAGLAHQALDPVGDEGEVTPLVGPGRRAVRQDEDRDPKLVVAPIAAAGHLAGATAHPHRARRRDDLLQRLAVPQGGEVGVEAAHVAAPVGDATAPKQRRAALAARCALTRAARSSVGA